MLARYISGVKTLLIKYQIIIFLALSFLISWIPWYTGGHGFFAWGPSLAGLIVVAAVGGRRGLGEMLRRLVRWRVRMGWWAVTLLLPLTLTFAAIVVHVITGGEAPTFTFWRQEWFRAPILIGILLSPFGGAGGEEPFGWRGYAQPKLQEKWGRRGPLMTSVIIGIVWGLWHLPEFFNPTSTQFAAGIGFMVPMTAMWIAASVIMTWLYNKTGASVLLSGVLFHLMLDVSSTTLLADFTLAGMTEGIPPLDLRLILAQVAVFALVALILVIGTKGQLGYSAEGEMEK